MIYWLDFLCSLTFFLLLTAFGLLLTSGLSLIETDSDSTLGVLQITQSVNCNLINGGRHYWPSLFIELCLAFLAKVLRL